MQLIIFGWHLQISKLGEPIRDRVHKIMVRRKKGGFCTQCGTKILEINKYTNLLYVKCVKCRADESRRIKARREKKKLIN